MKFLNKLNPTHVATACFAFVYAAAANATTGGQYNATSTSDGTTLLGYQQQAGVASQKLTNTTGNLGKMIADFLNLFLIGMTAFGIVLFGIGLYGVYKANADERETPKKAIWGMVIGAGMTCITTLAFLLRNNIVG